jgi:alpha-L-fucosidase
MYRWNINKYKIYIVFFAALIIALIAMDSATAQSGPNTTPEIVAAAAKAGPEIPSGPFEPKWDSIKANYKVPDWWLDAKFGIFMHWGLYAVPAHASEWYAKHMYGNSGITQWHTEKFGAPDKFGYEDFIPMFTCEKYDPDVWADLFKKAGAKFVVPTAIHHDGFSLWDSSVNKWNAKNMGPKRDLIGDMAKAMRKKGLKFGVSHHGIEHFTFIQPTAGLPTDLLDPASADFYSVADRSPQACQKFLEEWVAQNVELIDKYQPDILWFDNGVNSRIFDPIKLKVAAYYYNRAVTWDKAVSLSTKADAYLAGTIKDFERSGRAPKELTNFVWQVDEPVLYRFGYTEGSKIAAASGVVRLLIECTSKNGALLLNISPKADGTIPDDQQKLLLGIGAWLDVNGEAIYGTCPWTIFGEGNPPRNEAAAATDAPPMFTPSMYRFTTKGDTLYAIAIGWPGQEAVITSLATGKAPQGKIESVTLLGTKGEMQFTQDEEGLKIKMPANKPCEYAYAIKIVGLKLK